MSKLLILAAVCAAGFLLAHRLIPWCVVRLGRLLGFRMRLTPIMARRVQRFKKIKRGYYAFLLITTLFVISLFLELLVNDKALLIVFEGRWSSPAVCEWISHLPLIDLPHYRQAADYGLEGDAPVQYRKYRSYCEAPDQLLRSIVQRERDLVRMRKLVESTRPPKKPRPPKAPLKPGPGAGQGELDEYKEAIEEYEFAMQDYDEDLKAYHSDLKDLEFNRNDLGAQQRIISRLRRNYESFKSGRAWIVMPLYPYSADNRLLTEIPGNPPHRPSIENGHYLGITDNGSDVLTQLVYGFRIAIIFALIVASIGYTIGVLVGGTMGYYGGWTDILVQRFIEIWGSIPFLFTMMIVSNIIKPGVIVLALLLIVLRSWMGITYTIRGEFYREKAKDYVSAATAMGVSDWKIITRHILPNSLVPVVTFAPFGIVAYISVLVSLDFLGFGLKPGTPSWGYLLQQGQTHITTYTFLILVPSLAFAATLFCVVMIGEAVREGFDPKVFSRLR